MNDLAQSHCGIDRAAVLLAEDNEDDAFLFLRALKQAAFPVLVEHVVDGEAAVNRLRGLEQGQEPAVIILDIKMPRMDGFETLAWIREQPRYQKLPIVLFSSSDQACDHARAENLGADDYLVKPISLAEYTVVIHSLLRKWIGLHLPDTQ
jgi:two-component system response regulator